MYSCADFFLKLATKKSILLELVLFFLNKTTNSSKKTIILNTVDMESSHYFFANSIGFILSISFSGASVYTPSLVIEPPLNCDLVKF